MPVARMQMSECPGDRIQTKAAGYNRVLIDVNVIVEVNEIVPECLTENSPGNRHEQSAHDEVRSARAVSRANRFRAQSLKPAGAPAPNGRSGNATLWPNNRSRNAHFCEN